MTTPDPTASMSPEELIAVIERGLMADEQAARAADADDWTDEYSEFHNRGGDTFPHVLRHSPARVLADVESKRAILAQYDPRFGNEFVWHPMLAALARPYLDEE